MAINLTEDVLKHSDEEVIEYLSSVMATVVKNYKTSLESKQPEVIWANYGDITMVYNILRSLKRRNDLRKAPEV